MRGERRAGNPGRVPAGITPAYAGRTQPAPRSNSISWDHPRVCGENLCQWVTSQVISGSPPRMRGEQGLTRPIELSPGITPAYAGRTDCGEASGACQSDHPRVCGENRMPRAVLCTAAGSPPRMRGERSEEDNAPVGVRITPAYAGRTIHRTRSSAVLTDHPRVCGENVLIQLLGMNPIGSPPRMRGERFGGCS